MNSSVIAAELVQAPELRYTSDNQTPVAEAIVQFPALREEEQSGTMKVIAWGDKASQLAELTVGTRVLLEGRLGIQSVERPEGFKEKKVELTITKIHVADGETISTPTTTNSPNASPSPATNGTATPRRQTTQSRPAAATPKAASASRSMVPAGGGRGSGSTEDPLDDIPF